jgi:FkbM family methyltransferase
MLHVACVRWGEAFSVDYVERLHDMVRRNLPAGFAGRFVCFTDRPVDLSHLAGVDVEPIEHQEGWWAKLELFQPGAFPKGDRVWYFDLDTAITGPLEKLFEYPGAFGLLQDVYRPNGFQSSVMSWIAGTPLVDSIWDEWSNAGQPKPAGGDQEVLELFWRRWLPRRLKGDPWPPDFLQSLFPGSLRSYKVECVWQIPKGTSVVFFHGLPRPHEVLTGWVPEVWKVGGGHSAEIVVVGTVPQERVLHNVAAAAAAKYDQLAATPAHGQVALIVGGGPSLADQLMLIANLQRGGALVFATNNTDRYLRERGIFANFHVMLDARPEIADFVCAKGIKLYASMCDPEVLEKADVLGELVIWHALTDHIDTVLGKAMLVGGGTTVGCRAMALAYVMGFRKIMCFGMDSSYAKGEHHAYAQPLNDGERVLDCVVGGDRFKAAPWMVRQAEDWKALSIDLTKMGCEITVMGEGMLAAIARSMYHEAVEIDGFMWPSHDVEGRASVLGTLADLDAYIHLCGERRVAVQAGGNVGIWPLELSKYFKTVHTFEPDSANFACLTHNLRTAANIAIHSEALGARFHHAAIQRTPTNCGASALTEGDEVIVVGLDSLNLSEVDLLQLDVEGYEYYALLGAQNTILRCRPLIVLERNGLNQRFGVSEQTIDQWLASQHYVRVAAAHRDVIYQPKEKIL